MSAQDNGGETQDRTCPICGRWDAEHTEGMMGPVKVVGCPLLPREAVLLAATDAEAEA